jgi:hypothetical protein
VELELEVCQKVWEACQVELEECPDKGSQDNNLDNNREAPKLTKSIDELIIS